VGNDAFSTKEIVESSSKANKKIDRRDASSFAEKFMKSTTIKKGNDSDDRRFDVAKTDLTGRNIIAPELFRNEIKSQDILLLDHENE
jgi:hypothetical protein